MPVKSVGLKKSSLKLFEAFVGECMNSALATGEMFRDERHEGLMSFLVSRSKKAVRSLTPSTAEVLHGCSSAIDQILLRAVQTRTKAEFQNVFDAAFPKYVSLSMAISHFATAVIQKSVREQLIRESIGEMEMDFKDKGLAAFGAEVRDQAIFTVWTLRKVNDLTTQIIATPLPKDQENEDEEYCTKFNLHALRAQFNLDCLDASLKSKQAIYPEVLEEVVDGLRSMVNAYTWARRGLEIRLPSVEESVEHHPLTSDDLDLMDFAFNQVEDEKYEDVSAS
jgi:hypothetical protein